MIARKGDAAGLGALLRNVASLAPQAAELAMRETGLQLVGIAAEESPVDQAQMKAGWRSFDVPGGAIVANLTKQAVWIERGRGPGPVPMGPIREWAIRKGLVSKTLVRRLAKRAASRLKGTMTPELRRGASGKSAAARMARADARAYNRRARSMARAFEKAAAQEQAVDAAVYPIKRKIELEGYAPRWVLRNAMERVRPAALRRLRAALKGLTP